MGEESAFRSITGMLIFLVLFLGIAFVVSMITYGALLRNFTVSPAPGGEPAGTGTPPGTRRE